MSSLPMIAPASSVPRPYQSFRSGDPTPERIREVPCLRLDEAGRKAALRHIAAGPIDGRHR